jgi:hypothetical protein
MDYSANRIQSRSDRLRFGNATDGADGFARAAVDTVRRFDEAFFAHFRNTLDGTNRLAGSAVRTFVTINNPLIIRAMVFSCCCAGRRKRIHLRIKFKVQRQTILSAVIYGFAGRNYINFRQEDGIFTGRLLLV